MRFGTGALAAFRAACMCVCTCLIRTPHASASASGSSAGRFKALQSSDITRQGQLENPKDLVVHGSDIFIADAGSHCIRKVTVHTDTDAAARAPGSYAAMSSSMSTLAGQCGMPGQKEGLLDQPQSLALDHAHQRLWVVDNSQELHAVDLKTGAVLEFDLEFKRVPSSVAVARASGHLLVGFPETSNYEADLRLILMCNTKSANWSPCVCQRPQEQPDEMQFFFQQMTGVQMMPSNRPRPKYCDTIQPFSLLSAADRAKHQIEAPASMSVDEDTGAVYLVDSSRNQLYKIAFPRDLPTAIRDVGYFEEVASILQEVTISLVAGTAAAGDMDGPASLAQFSGPHGVAFDHATRGVLVADSYNSAVRCVWPGGARDVQTLMRVANGAFKPVAVAPATPGHVDARNHPVLLYVLDGAAKKLVAFSEAPQRDAMHRQGSSWWTLKSLVVVTTLVCIIVLALIVVFFNDLKHTWRRRRGGVRYHTVVPRGYVTHTQF